MPCKYNSIYDLAGVTVYRYSICKSRKMFYGGYVLRLRNHVHVYTKQLASHQANQLSLKEYERLNISLTIFNWWIIKRKQHTLNWARPHWSLRLPSCVNRISRQHLNWRRSLWILGQHLRRQLQIIAGHFLFLGFLFLFFVWLKTAMVKEMRSLRPHLKRHRDMIARHFLFLGFLFLCDLYELQWWMRSFLQSFSPGCWLN